MEHAEKWQPSSSHVWANCNGYPEMKLKADIQDIDTEYTKEGEAAHWYVQQVCTGQPAGIGSVAPNGITIDEEIVGHCQVYIDIIQNTPGQQQFIEFKVPVPEIHKDCFGTCDHWSYCIHTSTLYITDLKYGWGLVEYWEPWNCYASGIISYLGVEPSKIVQRVVQPRPWHPQGPVRERTLSMTDLKREVSRLRIAANDVFPTLNTGSWCKNCEAQLFCPSNYRAAFNAIHVSGMYVQVEKANLGREIDILREAKEILTNRLSAVETQAESDIASGTLVEGWSLDVGRSSGRSYWTEDIEKVKAAASLFNVTVTKESLLTPAQTIKAGLPKETVQNMSRVASGKLTLVKTEKTKAYRAFAKEV